MIEVLFSFSTAGILINIAINILFAIVIPICLLVHTKFASNIKCLIPCFIITFGQTFIFWYMITSDLEQRLLNNSISPNMLESIIFISVHYIFNLIVGIMFIRTFNNLIENCKSDQRDMKERREKKQREKEENNQDL